MSYNHRISFCLFLLALLFAFCGLPEIARGYTYAIQNLGILNEDYPLASGMWVGGINAKGDVVGTCWPSANCSDVCAGYISIGGQQMQQLATIDGSFADTHPIGLNDKGLIVGRSGIESAPHGNYACLWSGDTVTNLDPGGSGSSVAYWINNNGQIIGDFQTITHAFFYESGTMTDLGTVDDLPNSHACAINASGQVIANCTGPNYNRSFLYYNGNKTELPTLGGNSNWVFDINRKGQIVGSASTTEYSHAFVYENESMIDLNTFLNIPEYYNSWAYAINDKGQITGGYSTEQGIHHIFLYNNGTITDIVTEYVPFCLNNRGQMLLNELNEPFLYSGGVINELNELIDSSLGWNIFGPWYGATGTMKSSFINDSGQIHGVGTMYIDDLPVHRPFVMTPFPWKAEGGGSWGNGNNWNVSELPGSVGDSVYISNWFGNTSGGNITLDGDRTLSCITFNFAGQSFSISAGYTIPTSKLILDNTDGSSAMIIDVAGSHYIAAPVELHTDLIVKTLDGCEIDISGQITEFGGAKSLTKSGEGKAILSASNSYTGETRIEEGIIELTAAGQINVQSLIVTDSAGTLKISGGTHTVGNISGTGTIKVDAGTLNVASVYCGSLHVGSGAKLTIENGGPSDMVDLDLGSFNNNGTIDIKDTIGVIRNTDFDTVYNQVKSGFSPPNPYWDGTGIVSSSIDTQASPRTLIGVVPDSYLKYTSAWAGKAFPNGDLTKSSSEVLLRYTLVGDSNLNGQTTASELAICIAAYKGAAPKLGGAAYTFVDGDINYDGKVQASDVAAVTAAYKSGVVIPSWDGFTLTPVPEPTTIILLSIGAVMLLMLRNKCSGKNRNQ